MKFKKAMVWSVIHSKAHNSLEKEETTIEALMPLLSAIFPGIDYYSISGFHQVLRELVKPTLNKLFPEIITMGENSVGSDEVEITKLLPSKGYEWQDSQGWQKEFRELLSVA